MPRGRPPKPVRIHQLEGTYRKHRHAAALAMEERLTTRPADRCDFCGWVGYPLISDLAERHRICRTCLEGGLALLDADQPDLPEGS